MLSVRFSRNDHFALAALAYVVVLYATLGATPAFFRWYAGLVGSAAYSRSITGLILLCGSAALLCSGRRLRGLSLLRGAGLLAVGGGYLLLLAVAETPAVRLHTLQYGLLAWLVVGLLRGRLSPSLLPGAAWALVMIVAIGDEAIQWVLPNRHGLLRDVSLDGGSAGLALAAMGLLGIFREGSAGARG